MHGWGRGEKKKKSSDTLITLKSSSWLECKTSFQRLRIQCPAFVFHTDVDHFLKIKIDERMKLPNLSDNFSFAILLFQGVPHIEKF